MGVNMALTVVEIVDACESHKVGAGTKLWALLWACTFIGLPYAAYLLRGDAVNKQNLALVEEINGRARAAFKSYIGADPQYIDTATVNKNGLLTGSGIAYLNGTIYFMQAGSATSFRGSQIRDFQYTVDTSAPIVLFGTNNVGSQLQVDIINLQQAHRAHLNSGLFLTIADIAYPEWHFMTSDRTMLKRWNEILQQVRDGVI